MPIKGVEHILVPHNENSVFMLRKLGYDAPSPIISQYDWAQSVAMPFEVQKKTCAMLTMNYAAYVLNGMGTGKTKCFLWAWDYLNKVKRAKRLLVVCPLSTMTFTWGGEIFATLPNRKFAVLHGTAKARFKMLADPETEIFIVNHDGVKVIEDELKKYPDIDTVVIDELAVYRNKSDRTTAMKSIAARMTWRWGGTGGPIPNAPTDVFWQAQIITPDRVPKRYREFEDSLMTRFGNFRLLPKPDAVDRAFEVMQPSVRFTLEDVAELPDLIERWVDVDMGPIQKKAYQELVKVSQTLALSGAPITAANAGVLMSKLLQVSLGWVYAADGSIIPFDNTARIQAMMDAIASTDRKVLIFAPYKHVLSGICDALTKAKLDHEPVSGDTPQKERARIFNLFQNTGKFKVLPAHPQCLAHGITLTAADTVLWMGPIPSLEIYDQANHRIRRVGQKFKQQIIHLQSTPIEKRVYKMLVAKQDVQSKLLSMVEELGGDQW